MSDITRPIKRGDVRTFDESYNKGYKNIWASEVDDEFDLLYDAWNYGTINIGPGSVGADQIINGSITSDKLAPNSVDEIHIVDGAVTQHKIADEAITSDKIYPGAVKGEHLGSNSVSGSEIIDGAVDEAELSTNVKLRLPPFYSAPQASKVLAVDATGSSLVWVSAPPSAPGGPAGGDLGGFYPNPVLKDPLLLGRVTHGKGTQFARSAPITADTTLSDSFTHWRVDAAAGPITITLPEAAANGGRFYIIQKSDGGGYPVILMRSGTNIFGAGPGIVIAADRSAVWLTQPYSVALVFATAYGVDWWVMYDDLPQVIPGAVNSETETFCNETTENVELTKTITTRGGQILILAGWNGRLTSSVGSAVDHYFHVRVRRDNATGQRIRTARAHFARAAGSGTTAIPFSAELNGVDAGRPAGTYTYVLTINNNAGGSASALVYSQNLTLVELS